MNVEQQLKKETEKWLAKLEKKLPKCTGNLDNIRAYVKDSKHFLDKKDLVRAFEAVIWAWACFEILEDRGEIWPKGLSEQEKHDYFESLDSEQYKSYKKRVLKRE